MTNHAMVHSEPQKLGEQLTVLMNFRHHLFRDYDYFLGSGKIQLMSIEPPWWSRWITIVETSAKEKSHWYYGKEGCLLGRIQKQKPRRQKTAQAVRVRVWVPTWNNKNISQANLIINEYTEMAHFQILIWPSALNASMDYCLVTCLVI